MSDALTARNSSLPTRVIGSIGTAILAACILLMGAPTPANADVDDFGYERWDVEVELDVDGEGRAVAQVTETLVALFPEHDQNRGIVRGIPKEYQDASTSPGDFSVTDEHGDPVPFETEEDGRFTVLLLGDDSYVHGRQTYVVEYTLRDVVLARDDGRADEFYWDLLPLDRAQPIGSFTAEVVFSPALTSELNGDARCYTGAAYSQDECRVAEQGSDERTFRIGPMPIDPREGATIAVGLEPGTVQQPPARLPSVLLDVVPFIVAGAAAATGVAGLIAVMVFRRKRRRYRGVVVPQYDVPAWFPPLIAGPIARTSKARIPAQLIHLAVNGVTRLEEGEGKSGIFGKAKPQPRIRLVDPAAAADQLDRVTMSYFFPVLRAGEAFTLPRRSESFAKKMQQLSTTGVKESESRGYLEKARSPVACALGLVTLGLILVLGVLVVASIASRNSITGPVCAFLLPVLVVMAIPAVCKHRVHTAQGAEAYEYLRGVEQFIRVAEADRLRMLQSYQGAERLQDGTVNVLHLYEKLLPYAMLFNLEREWVSVLEVKYSESPGYSPAWYPAGMHGMQSFNSTLSQFTSSLASSVSYTSSSSGGSSGGGFSGGGGGGGFSGGR